MEDSNHLDSDIKDIMTTGWFIEITVNLMENCMVYVTTAIKTKNKNDLKNLMKLYFHILYIYV